MMSKIDRNIAVFRALFRGRQDAYGAGGGMCVKQALSADVLVGHLSGEKRIGVYPLSPTILDGEGVYWACLDIDDSDLNLAIESMGALAELGVQGYIERSKRKGYHVWVFFAEPVPANHARALLRYAGAEHEIFPKQDKLVDGGYGNYVNLPLFGADVEHQRTVFLDPKRGYEPHPDQFAFLEQVEKVTPNQLAELVDSGELDIANPKTDPQTEQGEQEKADYSDMMPCVQRMMQGVSEGCRDTVAFTLAKHFRIEKNLPQSATLGILLEWNRWNKPPLPDKTIVEKVKSAYQGRGGAGYTSFGCENELIKPFCNKSCILTKKPQTVSEFLGENLPSATKTGAKFFNGAVFVPPRLANELMRRYSFIFVSGRLYVYNKGYYAPIGEEFVKERCRELLGEDAKAYRLYEVLEHIRDMSFTYPEQLNTHKHLINFQNGMYDVRSKLLVEHDKAYLSTIRIPVKYEPSASCPTIKRFFCEVLPQDCIQTVEELFGYVLIPDTRYEKAFMFVGAGANGKSTLISLLERFIGKANTSKIPLQELSDNRFKRADLFGKLLNVFADLDAKSLQSSTYFKVIVSGDMMDAERKHCDPFYFAPFARLVYSANEIPRSPDRSLAYYRRWCIIPFPNTFRGADADKHLIAQLTRPDELSGLLNIALAGLYRLFEQDDFTESETSKAALEAYKKSNDTVFAFITDWCVREGATERSEFYNIYCKYCEEEGYRPVSRQGCYLRVRALGIGEKTVRGKRFFDRIMPKNQ